MPNSKTRAGPKGESSVVAYVLIFLMAIALTSTAYAYVLPRLVDMKSKAELEYMSVYMRRLDERIRAVAHGGENSKDYVTFNLQQGTLGVCDVENKVEYSITSNTCLQTDAMPGIYFETEEKGMCVNKIILNYTSVDITNNVTFDGFFQLHIENIGFQNNKPLLKIA